ncbi:DUF2336 domain-containing protein [Salinarimonas soli]|uniref:DUF2336 domain-containing protein n=1 Tax=Salinarimonas soli TaxID=1638099 RepID=A0A5B2V9W3_9HYPH|nr:DUF2336 domain-containing protein [Salinarimonas soli]KAA2236293.1 DUF2336 domain-containing protein [Salinarimonas soli]
MTPDPEALALRTMVAELEGALVGGSPERARDLMEKLTVVFLRAVDRLGPDGALAFDEAFVRLLAANAPPARARLSQVVAPFANAPRRTVRLLAYDEEAVVAGPVLRASPVLDEDDLIVVARERGPEHLLAVSQRPAIPEAVTDLLVQRGGPEIVLSAVRNRGAKLSNRSCAHILASAAATPDLRRALQLRTDVAQAQLARIGAVARASARPASPPRSVAKLGAIFRMFLARAERETPRLRELSQALLAVHMASQARRLDEPQVADWLRKGEHDKAVAAIAFVTRLPVTLVQRAHRSAEPDGFELILCAAGYGFDTFELALMSNPVWRLEPEDVERLVVDYRELRPEEAQLAIRLATAHLRRTAGERRA